MATELEVSFIEHMYLLTYIPTYYLVTNIVTFQKIIK